MVKPQGWESTTRDSLPNPFHMMNLSDLQTFI
uniref:Uncharacterized protein n=1 Tax=Anguilla anguilla TaxID=7936 RepID=A0A0E9T5E3_ANGAN